jgi:hypothetical protein
VGVVPVQVLKLRTPCFLLRSLDILNICILFIIVHPIYWFHHGPVTTASCILRLFPCRNTSLMKRQAMIDGFESQLEIVLQRLEGTRPKRLTGTFQRLPVDVAKIALLPIEVWDNVTSGAKMHNMRTMAFAYDGKALVGQLNAEQEEEEEDDASDSYVAGDDFFQRPSDSYEAVNFGARGTEAAAAAADAAADDEDGSLRQIFEPTYSEVLLDSETVAEGGDLRQPDNEATSSSSLAKSAAAAAAAAEEAASYQRAGCWARPASHAASADSSAPLLRCGHSLVAFPVALPTHPAHPHACRYAPSVPLSQEQTSRQMQAQYVSPSAPPRLLILQRTHPTFTTPAISFQRRCRWHHLRWF